MAESVDALVSNTSGATRAGSTPALGTSKSANTSGATRAGSTPALGTSKSAKWLNVNT